MADHRPAHLFYPILDLVSRRSVERDFHCIGYSSLPQEPVEATTNIRVAVLPYSSSSSLPFGPATRVLGQDNMTSNAPNLIEGKEFRFTVPVSSTQSAAGGGIVVDASGATRGRDLVRERTSDRTAGAGRTPSKIPLLP